MTITIKTVKSASYYFANVNFNYLSEGGDAPGHFFGSAASVLGLNRRVEKNPFQRLLSGMHPTLDKSLVQIQRSDDPLANEHRPGFDVTFLPPKSVSVLWAVSNRVTRRRIELAVRKAIRDTISWLEANVPLTRRGKGGHIRELAKLVIAQFDHVQNRNGEPLLHQHNVFCNVCQRADGTWGTLDSKTLYAWIRTLGPVFRANLAHELRNTLGIELVEPTDKENNPLGWFEVKHVPKSLIEAWSTRRAEIIEAIEGDGGAIGESSAKARAKATLETREAKDIHALPRETMHTQWREEAAKHRFTEQAAEKLLGRVQQDGTQTHDAFPKAWKEALQQITETEAHFTERLLVQKVCERLQMGQFSGSEIASRVKHELAHSPEIVPLRDKGADRQFTTKEMWELEEDLFKDVEVLRSRPGAQVSEKIIQKTLEKNKHLDGEQVEATRMSLSANSAIRVLTGVAGSGKTITLKTVAQGFEAEGHRVVGAAVSGIAKEELAQKAGISSRTVASYLAHLEKPKFEKRLEQLNHLRKQIGRDVLKQSTWERDTPYLDAKTVLVIDEASMLGSRMMRTLVKHAVQAGCTILLVGDNKQIQPIEAGMPLRRIAADAPLAHLTVNRRQQNAQDQEAVRALREGEAKQAIENYAERGLVTVASTRREAIQNLVKSWKEGGGAKSPEKIAVYVPTRREAAEINRCCQKARLEAAKTPHLAFVSNASERYYRGDRVLFHAPQRLYGVENGFRGTVLSVDPIRSEIKVRLDQKPVSHQKGTQAGQVVTIPVKRFGEDISLGYAMTTHKGQSQSVEHALLLMGGKNTDRELAYVQATRAKQSTKIFIDRAHAGEQLQDLIDAVEKSRPKLNAHDQSREAEKKQQQKLEQQQQKEHM